MATHHYHIKLYITTVTARWRPVTDGRAIELGRRVFGGDCGRWWTRNTICPVVTHQGELPHLGPMLEDQTGHVLRGGCSVYIYCKYEVYIYI